MIFTACSGSVVNNKDESGSKVLILKNWEYNVNISPPDSAAFPVTNKDSIISSKWVSIASLHDLPKKLNGKSIWLRTKLPEWNGTAPGIYIGQVNYAIQVFLDGKMIYQLGDSSSSKNMEFIGWNQNLIKLPYYKKGEELTIRCWLGDNSFTIKGNVLLGSTDKIIKDIFLQNIDDLLFASIFLIIGIIFFILYFVLQRLKLLLGIAVYLTSLGVFIASNSLFLQSLFPAPMVYYNLDYISFVSSTVGGFFSVELIIGEKYKKVLRYIWVIHLVFLFFSIMCILFTKITYLDLLNYFLLLLTIDMLICLVEMFLSARSGEYTSKVLIAGMSVFILFAILEIYFYLRDELSGVYDYSVRILHIGALCFVVSLIWITIYHYINTYKQKEIAKQKELDAVKRENEVREQFAMKLIESQENERNRIALELHDSIGQKLLLIKNQLLLKIRTSPDKESTELLRGISNLTGETIREVRTISCNLRPQHLDQLGLTTAIEIIVEEVSESSDIKFHLSVDDIDELLPKQDEINFFRIVQESINNIVKHSQAADAIIKIKKTNTLIDLEISDNGIGIKKNILHMNKGLGLTGMHERARMINARLSIIFPDDGGTIIEMEYPLKKYKEKNGNEKNDNYYSG